MPVTSISGFPEWLPDERIVEQLFLDELRNQFELFGFQSLETRLFEPLDWLLGKGGDVDKEIYGVHRVNASEDDSGLGLHFDLTVPLARYVVENAGRLNFPFARYQIQKVYRGERAQEGRFREFYQADVDVIGKGELPLHYDAEMLLLIDRVYKKLPLPAVTLRVNNRKISQGFYQALGIEQPTRILRLIDKLDKIGFDAVKRALVDEAGCTEAQASSCLGLAEIRSDNLSFVQDLRSLGVSNDRFELGVQELESLMGVAIEYLPKGSVMVDCALARGLDYYDGSVFEAYLLGHEALGSVCGGGRYSKLATAPDGATYPGVGVSFGVNRMLSRLISSGAWSASRKVPTCVMVALPSEEARHKCYEIALALRDRGIACELAPSSAPYGKQIREAERRGIPFVWFPDTGQVKDIRSGDQVEADPTVWMPTADDLHPRIKVSDGG